MTMRSGVSFCAVVACALVLAACGGGGGGSSSGGGGGSVPVTPTNPPSPPPAGALAVTPTSLAFASAASGAQTFTISSTLAGTTTPTVNGAGCAPVVSVASTAATLPATFTVTPSANGTCTIVLTSGHQSVSLGISVGPVTSPTFTGTGNGLSLAYPGGTGNYTVSADSGAIGVDTSACSGIASITVTGAGTTSASFVAGATAPGSCAVTISDGSSSYAVPISVTQTPGTGVAISPSAVSVSASALATSGPITLSASGLIGNVTIDESSCTSANAKLAFFTLTSGSGTQVSLPQTGTVTAYGGTTGSCQIIFTPTTGAAAVLTVYVTP